MTLSDFFFNWKNKFLEELDLNERSDLTYASYERVLNFFVDYITISKYKSLEEIDHKAISDFIKHREDNAKKLKNKNSFEYKTKILYRTILKIFFSFIEDDSDDKYSFNIKWKRLQFKKNTKEKTHLEESIEEKVLKYLDNLIVRANRVSDWNKLNKTQKRELKNLEYVYMLNFTFKLGIYLGLRVSEICNLKLKNFSKPYKTSTNQQLIDIMIDGKGNKERRMPIVYSRIKKEHIFFKKIKRDSDSLFSQINGNALTRVSLYNYFKEVGVNSGTNLKGCHILRHTFTYKMSDSGIDVADAQDMLGHSDISTTRIYFKRNPNRMRRVATLI